MYIDWGPDFRRQHDAALPEKAKAALSFNLGPLALQYILENGGSGYFRTRVVQSYLENGVLKHAVLGRKRGEAALLSMLRLPRSQVVFKEGSFPNLPANVTIPWGEFMASLLERGGEETGAS